MRCRSCGGRTRVVHTQQKDDGAHRWLRCLECEALTRTLETYVLNHKPGPPPGRPKRGGIARGSRNANAVLTEDDVLHLRQEADQGALQEDLATKYGIHPDTVSRIVRRKLWRHV